LERQVKARKDYIAPTGRLLFLPAEKGVTLSGLPNRDPLAMTNWATGQVRSHFKIDAKYFERMRNEAPDLLAHNLNHWATAAPDVKRMVRTVDDHVRAWVSDSYRCLDSIDLANAALPVLAEKGAEIVSAEVTETRLYLKATLAKLEMRVEKSKAVGDVLRGGIMLRNSEVGNGALEVAFFVTRLICMNGMVSDSLFRRAHLGRRKGAGLEDATEFFSDRTRKLDDEAFFAKVRDVLTGSLSEEYLEEIVAKANGAAEDRIVADAKLEDVVEVTTKRLALPEGTRSPIFRNLIEGGDLSRWGLANAVTAVANKTEDYEDATALESAGGKILDLSPSEWSVLNKAAA
jgi:hypothetical protein